MDKLGFEVIVIENPKNANDVLKTINAFVCRGDQIECNAFGVAFMSHGNKNGTMETWEDTIRVEQIINGVKGQNALTGKPKLFIFQGKKMTSAQIETFTVTIRHFSTPYQ